MSDLTLRAQSERELKRAFDRVEKRYGFQTAQRTFNNIFKRVIDPIFKEMRENAPVKRGNLRRSVRRRSEYNKKYKEFTGSAYVSLRRSKSKPAGGRAYVSYFQALAVEYGTQHQAEQKFMRRAFENNKDEALRTLGRLLGDDVDRIAEETYNRAVSKGLKT